MSATEEFVMRVEQVMTKSVRTCMPEDSLAHAAQVMWDADCGCLPVCDGAGRVVGMITDRDICMSALFQGRALHELRVSGAMAKEVRTCAPADSFTNAERIMREQRIRRLPVIRDGILLGIVSLADLARQAARAQTHPYSQVKGEEIGITLASICEPRGQPPSTAETTKPHEVAI